LTTKKPTIQPSAWTSVLLAPSIITPEFAPPADLRNLLDYLHLQWAANPDAPGPHVVHVMDHYCALSTTTVHRQLSALAKKGFINLVAHEDDRRKKHIEPTKKTVAYYEYLTQALVLFGDPKMRGKVLHCTISEWALIKNILDEHGLQAISSEEGPAFRDGFRAAEAFYGITDPLADTGFEGIVSGFKLLGGEGVKA